MFLKLVFIRLQRSTNYLLCFSYLAPLRENYFSKFKGCYESCIQNFLAYDVKSIAFCCVATIICELDHRKAVRVALSTVRLWMEFILSIVSFYAHRKMSTSYFHVLKYHLTVNHTNLKMIMIVINFSLLEIKTPQ